MITLEMHVVTGLAGDNLIGEYEYKNFYTSLDKVHTYWAFVSGQFPNTGIFTKYSISVLPFNCLRLGGISPGPIFGKTIYILH